MTMTTKTKTITADDARALLQGSAPGPWVVGTVVGNGNDSPGAVFDVTAETCGVGEAWACRANARLMAAAPDLALAVIALEAERARCLDGVNRLLAAQREDSARLVAERDAALREAVSRHDTAHRARQERDEALAEVERLRAIIEGRTTPPTREEVDVVVNAGGWWQCGTDDGEWGVSVCAHYSDVRGVLRDAAEQGVSLRWWAHDRTGRPCARPTVTP